MTAITRRQTVTEIVSVYEQAAQDIRSGFALIAGAEDRLNAAYSLADCGKLYVRDRHRHMNFHEVDDVLDQLKRQTWGYLVERLELRRMLSIQRAEELDRQLRDGELPDITVESVMAFADGYMMALPDMLKEAVGEVFEMLRPRGHTRVGQLKTNSELEIPKRVILGYAIESGYGLQSFRPSYHYDKNLTALENVFTALDGRGQVTRAYHSELSDAIKATGPDGRGETRYFRFRACKNRNLHLEFLRLDLLAKLNAIAGGKRLRPAA